MNRPTLHDRLALIALLSGLPALAVALFFLRKAIDGSVLFGLAAAGLVVSDGLELLPR